MTIKEAILKSLEDFDIGGTIKDVFQNIIKKGYYEFTKGKTPENTVSALLGDFIRNGDSRVKRFKNKDNVYCYYLTKNENKIDISNIENISSCTTKKNINKVNSYMERDLHLLLTTYLKEQGIYAKTIFHEQSNKNEEYQKWVHPDLIGAKFIEFNNKICQSIFKATNHTNTVDIYSYELKKEISSDYELKRYFFQAVSNSSWANYGFLVAFEIGDNLLDELERLSHSFGIGVILLKANPFESQVLFPAKHKSLDFKTIEKLCNINKDFGRFFEQIEKVITVESKYAKDVKKGMEDLCDKYLNNDIEIENYCKEKNIPLKDNTL